MMGVVGLLTKHEAAVWDLVEQLKRQDGFTGWWESLLHTERDRLVEELAETLETSLEGDGF